MASILRGRLVRCFGTLGCLAVCGTFPAGCLGPAMRFYARDLSSGLLQGPFLLRDDVTVTNRAGEGFLITEPYRGEVETMERLRSITVDCRFDRKPLPDVVAVLMEKQRQVAGASNAVPLYLVLDAKWHLPLPNGSERGEEIVPALPEVTFTADQEPLLTVLYHIQQAVNGDGYPLRLKLDRDGATLWLFFPNREW